jgi:acyl-CoA synthetase (AMP-forming)/AMP-acid ligase II
MSTRTAREADWPSIENTLFGPDAFFELAEEEILGEKMKIFKTRRRSLREYVAASADFGDTEYIIHGDRRITYKEHADLVASTARFLADRFDIRHGDRVAIYSENRPEWIIAYWAIVSLGAVATALNGWWTDDEVAFGLEITEPKVLLADGKRLARISNLDLSCPVFDFEKDSDEMLSHAVGADLPNTPIAEDDPSTILFTSGTTGRPKCALASHRAVIGFVQSAMAGGARAMMLEGQLGYEADPDRPQTCMLLTVPLFHVSGLYSGAIMGLASGGKTVWRSGRFEPEAVLELMEGEKVTQWTGIGSMAHRVLYHPRIKEFDLSHLSSIGSGGAPTSPTMLERMKEVAALGVRGRGLGYGLSESVATITGISGLELADFPTSVGRASATVEIEIRDPQGKALPEGEQGEVYARSPYLMLEYYRNPEATAKTILPGRWLATGDIGHLENEYLYINSRARDLILRSGENIYPTEIEHRLEAHPTVGEAAVLGVDSEEFGQEVKAIVVPKIGTSGGTIDPGQLSIFCQEKLASFKVPTIWEVREEPLPRNASGKILKNVLSGEVENKLVDD